MHKQNGFLHSAHVAYPACEVAGAGSDPWHYLCATERSCNRKGPTHCAAYDTEKKLSCLLPLRTTKVGDEFSFDYEYEKGKDVKTYVSPADP